MQKKFDDGGAGFGQQAFKIVDVGKAALGFGLVYPAFYARDQHVFVVAAVENHQFAAARHHLVDAPQIIVRQLRFGGCFKSLHTHAQRVYILEYFADGAVFAGGVHALQHHQHFAFAFGIEQVLQGIQLRCQCGHLGIARGFVVGGLAFVGRVIIGQFQACAGFDAVLFFQLRHDGFLDFQSSMAASILKPSQIPAKPPATLNNTLLSDHKLPPHSSGT